MINDKTKHGENFHGWERSWLFQENTYLAIGSCLDKQNVALRRLKKHAESCSTANALIAWRNMILHGAVSSTCKFRKTYRGAWGGLRAVKISAIPYTRTAAREQKHIKPSSTDVYGALQGEDTSSMAT
jgi:hypothetical protein